MGRDRLGARVRGLGAGLLHGLFYLRWRLTTRRVLFPDTSVRRITREDLNEIMESDYDAFLDLLRRNAGLEMWFHTPEFNVPFLLRPVVPPWQWRRRRR